MTRRTVSGPDPSDPAGPPLSTTATYTCDGIAWGYEQRYLDGEKIKSGDYQVTLLRGTMRDDALALAPSFVPASGDVIAAPPPGSTTPINGRVVKLEAVTEAFVTCQVRGVPFG